MGKEDYIMDAIRFPAGRTLFHLLIAVIALVVVNGQVFAGGKDLVDQPVFWYDTDRQDIPQPRERFPNLYKDMVGSSVMDPIGRTMYPPRQIRAHGPPIRFPDRTCHIQLPGKRPQETRPQWRCVSSRLECH